MTNCAFVQRTKLNACARTSRPVAPSRTAERFIAKALEDRDVAKAKTFVKSALGHDPEQITQIQAHVAPIGDMNRNRLQSPLSDAQRLDFLLQVEHDAGEMMKIILDDPQCFTPNVGSSTFGNFWGILGTREYIRLLMTISLLYEQMENYERSYEYNLRILTYNQGDNTGTRTNFNLLQTKIGRDLEAYNFAFHLIDQHLNYEEVMRAVEGKDYPRMVLTNYSKEDIDPQDDRVHHRSTKLSDSAVLFTGALALFKLFGPCPKATAWLAAGNKRNKHILPILMNPSAPSYPKDRFISPRSPGSFIDGADFVVFTKEQFCTPEAQAWLAQAAKELPKRKCESLACTKVEAFFGEWRRCTGCMEAYYCSAQCQKEHWSMAGKEGHKKPCLQQKEIRNMVF